MRSDTPQDLPLSFDRTNGATDYTLSNLSAEAAGTYHETFHFVLNNHVAKDNRIPPYQMSYTEAEKRNALPVPADQYGAPVTGGSYNHWDEMTLNPPVDAMYATIDLLYPPTSWEYIQFLWKANTGQNAFLANEGVNLLDAWLKTGMAAPYVMASTTWGSVYSTTDTLGIAVLQWKTSRKQAAGNYSAVVTNIIKSGYEYTFDSINPDSVAFTIR